ncbi:unnamed protein product, partial [Larinioides sclopetarius]
QICFGSQGGGPCFFGYEFLPIQWLELASPEASLIMVWLNSLVIRADCCNYSFRQCCRAVRFVKIRM